MGGGGGGKGPEKGYRGLGRESGKFYYDITKIFRFPPPHPLGSEKNELFLGPNNYFYRSP